MSVRIIERESGTVLAQAAQESEAIKYENNWYIVPERVTADRLRVTDRTYTCPYKGTCNWVDFVGMDGRVVPQVAWIYPEPRSGHETIRGRYGFYSGMRGPTQEE